MSLDIGGWKAKEGAGISVNNVFEVNAEVIDGRWYFFFVKKAPQDMPSDLKSSGADFEMSKWDMSRVENKIAKLMVRHDISKRILDNIFRRQ